MVAVSVMLLIRKSTVKLPSSKEVSLLFWRFIPERMWGPILAISNLATERSDSMETRRKKIIDGFIPITNSNVDFMWHTDVVRAPTRSSRHRRRNTKTRPLFTSIRIFMTPHFTPNTGRERSLYLNVCKDWLSRFLRRNFYFTTLHKLLKSGTSSLQEFSYLYCNFFNGIV